MSSSRQEAAHALYVGDYERWPDPPEWEEIEDTWDMLRMSVDELQHPSRPACDGEGYTWPDHTGDEDDDDPSRTAPPTASSTVTWAATRTCR